MKVPGIQKAHDTIRGYVTISFGVVVIWQVYLQFLMFKYTPAVKASLENLGAEQPAITLLYTSIYHWSPILSIITLVVVIDILRRKGFPKTYAIIAFSSAAMVTLLLQMLFVQAIFTPFFQLIKLVGE